jgi:hypothetical protein
MAIRITTTGDLWARTARLVAAVLLLGGMVAAPVVHLVVGPDQPVAVDHAGHEHGESRVPDAHHDCPVCITLSSAAAPVVPAVHAAVTAGTPAAASPVSEPRDRGRSDSSRARAPPPSEIRH